LTCQHVFTSVILELFWTGDDPSVACDSNSFVAGFSCSVGPSDMVLAQPRNRAGHISHSLLMGTINIPDTGEGAMPDLSRIISAVLNTVGIANVGAQNTGGTGNTPTVAIVSDLHFFINF
jgi:hypothetical protein